MCFHLYYFYSVSPSKTSNHNPFYKFLSCYECVHALSDQNMDRNTVIKKHYSSTEAVKLFEEDDDEVTNLLV